MLVLYVAVQTYTWNMPLHTGVSDARISDVDLSVTNFFMLARLQISKEFAFEYGPSSEGLVLHNYLIRNTD